MARTVPAFPQRQSGQSLISMLVGVLISLVTIAAMMVLYKTMIEVSANASRSALRDGQVSAALLAAQMDLQNAGFGVAPADAMSTKLVVRESGKAVVWRYRPDLASSSFSCSGLVLVDAQGLYRYPAKACTDADSVSWNANEREPLAGSAAFFTPAQKGGAAYDAAEAEAGAMSLAPGYVFTLKTQQQCLPYMQQDFSNAPLHPAAQQLAMERDDGSSHLFQLCLPNLMVTS